MPSTLRIIEPSASLQAIERRVREAEDGTCLELVSLAAATVAGRAVNVLTLTPRVADARITLVEIDGVAELVRQEIDACARHERGGRRLVSYAMVWVAGRRANVAAYRG
jgi:hypothetical protein